MSVLQLVNRTQADAEFMFNSVPYVVKGGKTLMVEADAAWHAYQKHIAKLDPITGQALFLFGVRDAEGQELRDCTPLDYVKEKNEELLDRSNMDGNFKAIQFNNPNDQKARVVPVQMQGAFSEQPSVTSGNAFADELRAPDLKEVGDGEK